MKDAGISIYGEPVYYTDAVAAGKVDPGSESTLLIVCGKFERVCRPDEQSIELALKALADKINFYKNGTKKEQ
jgi:hypothetical protein